MSKEIISDKQGIILVTLFISGATVVLPTAPEAERDLWIAAILGILMALPMIIIYARLLSLYPNKTLFDISEFVLGSFIGKTVNVLYIWFAFFLGSFILRDLGEFVTTVSLTETPMVVPIILFTIMLAWGVISGIEVLGRWGEFFFPLTLFIMLFAIAFLTTEWDINNIQPVFYKGIEPILKGAYSTFTFPYAETIVIVMICSCLKRKNSSYKLFISGILIGGAIVVLTSLSEMLALGINGYKGAYFPSYSAVSRINVGNFLQRLEIIVSIVFFIGLYIKCSICLLATCKGVASIFKLNDYRYLVIPISIMMINVTIISFENIVDFRRWTVDIWPYYAFPFQVIIPIILWGYAELNKRKKTRSISQ